jgi:regulator of cell morphogenesis and NO signaling
MSIISNHDKLADVIHRNYLLLSVVNRFGIRLGFGDKSISNICEDAGIDADFFTAILNTVTSERFFPEQKLKQFPILQIVDYLKKTHAFYRDVELKIIDEHLNNFIQSGKNTRRMRLIREFFDNYKAELLTHLKREEEQTFPYIEQLVALGNQKDEREAFRQLSKKYRIHVFASQHENVDETLFDLKNILIKYLNDDYDQPSCNAVIFELYKLEKDLIGHTRLENNILIPMVEALEHKLSGNCYE